MPLQHLVQKPMLGTPINWTHPLSHGVLGCWLMNEGSGDRIYDSSGNGSDGTLQADAKFTPTQMGPALLLDGTGDYVNGGDSDLFDFKKNFAISIWVRITGAADNEVFVSKSPASGNDGYFLNRVDDDKVRFAVGDGTSSISSIFSDSALSVDTWYHVHAQYAFNETAIFIDGTKQADTDTGLTADMADHIADLDIGKFTGSVWFLNGQIAYLLIYGRGLSPAEITELTRDPYGMFESSRTRRRRKTKTRRERYAVGLPTAGGRYG